MNLGRLVDKLLSVGGMAGVLALIITTSICYRYVRSGDQVFPEVMTYALTTILGFYFGTAVKSAPTPSN
jgi:hypothetical protein